MSEQPLTCPQDHVLEWLDKHTSLCDCGVFTWWNYYRCQTNERVLDVVISALRQARTERDAALADNAALLKALLGITFCHHDGYTDIPWAEDCSACSKFDPKANHPGARVLAVVEAATELVDAITNIQASPYQSDSNYWGILGFRSDAHAHALLTRFDQAQAAVDALHGQREGGP